MQYFLTLLLKCSFTMSAVVLALMAFTPLLLKRYSAKWQYYIWLIVVIGFLIPFRFSINIGFLSVAAPASSTSQAPTVTAAQQLSQGISETGAVNVAGSGTDGQTSPAIPWWNVAVFLWLAGAVTTIAIQVFRHRRFLSSVQRWGAEISDQQISDILNVLSVEMKISKQIRLWACPNIVSPMMIGFRNPVILLPEAEYSGNEIYYILKHELVHWKRRDLWYKSLVLLSVAVHWFNPVLYLMARAIAVQCEISCDAEVMNGTDSEQRQCYSETILHATQHRSKMHTALSTGFYGGKSGMKARISSIMDSRKKKTGVAISCIVLVTTIATGATFTAAQATAGNKVTEPFQAVAGELLNTCNFPIVLPGYLPSPPGGDEYQWSIIPDIKSDTYSIEIDQKEPEDTLGMYIGSVSGNTGEPAEQQLEQQFESGDIKATDISLSNGVTGKEYVQDTDAYGGTAIAWKTGNWSFLCAPGRRIRITARAHTPIGS